MCICLYRFETHDKELQKFTGKLDKLETQMDRLVELVNALTARSTEHDRRAALQSSLVPANATPQTIFIRDFEHGESSLS